MDALILFSHGSLLCGAGRTLDAHAATLRRSSGFPIVEIGYLNYSEPAFGDAVARCAASGATRIVALPYFLVPGKFVSEDLPREVQAAAVERPGIEFVVAEPIGLHPALADAVTELADLARGPASWHDLALVAPDYCRANPRCPLYQTPACPNGASRKAAKSQSSPRNSVRSDFKNRKSDGQTALLLLAHGSPFSSANSDLFRLIELLRDRGEYRIVHAGFLECNEPTIPQAIEGCIAAGASGIAAVPYFLHTGRHVAVDLPSLLEAGQERYPDVDFRLGDFLGRSPHITTILAERAAAAISETVRR